MLIELNILNTAMTTPITISEQDNISEEVRLKYRYLDLRKPNIKKTIYYKEVRLLKVLEILYLKITS